MPPSEPALNQRASASTTRFAWPHGLTLLLLFATSIAVRLRCLTTKPFWFDECYSVELARIGWGNFLRLLWWREANMSLYYLLLRIWLHFGSSESFIRSLSVVMAVATLPAVYWLARQLYDRRVGLIAAVLFAFNAYSVRYAQEARSYALFLLLATLSSGFLVVWLRQPTRRKWLGYVVTSVLTVYSHFYALLLLVGHWLAAKLLSLERNQREPNAGMPSASTAIAIAVAPLLIFVAKTGAGPIRWIQRPSVRDVAGFYENLAGSNTWVLLVIYGVACASAIAPVGKNLFARAQVWETWRCQFLLVWLFFPAALTVLLSFARPVFLGRYMIFCLPALLILTAAGLARLRPAWLLGIALCATLLFSQQGVFFVYGHDFDNERDASAAAIHFILDHAQPRDGIIFHIAATRVPYEFYRSIGAGENTARPEFSREFGPQIIFPHHADGLDYRDFTGKPAAEFLRSATPGYPRVWVMLMNNGPGGTPDPTTVMLTEVLSESFPRSERWQFPRLELRLYSRL